MGPTWWIMKVVPMIPWGGIVPGVFLFLFIMIDKGDEFQLVQFILRFKGTQFISHGLIKSILGFVTYYTCNTAYHPDLDEHTCELNGPGVQAGWRVFEIMFVGWVLQILLVRCAL